MTSFVVGGRIKQSKGWIAVSCLALALLWHGSFTSHLKPGAYDADVKWTDHELRFFKI